ncbi:hypothetical protein I317_04530 [Kwoniella heveanensis CBS 569]|nr:hypothetical protein I317_04530 [Kwoniella heveanensis CBS 569]
MVSHFGKFAALEHSSERNIFFTYENELAPPSTTGTHGCSYACGMDGYRPLDLGHERHMDMSEGGLVSCGNSQSFYPPDSTLWSSTPTSHPDEMSQALDLTMDGTGYASDIGLDDIPSQASPQRDIPPPASNRGEVSEIALPGIGLYDDRAAPASPEQWMLCRPHNPADSAEEESVEGDQVDECASEDVSAPMISPSGKRLATEAEFQLFLDTGFWDESIEYVPDLPSGFGVSLAGSSKEPFSQSLELPYRGDGSEEQDVRGDVSGATSYGFLSFEPSSTPHSLGAIHHTQFVAL